MKKQINPTIKAHLLRGAFYLLLLLVACAIPFALAQRNAAKRSAAATAPNLPQRTSGSLAAHVLPIPRAPKAPQVVLYDQYDNGSATATLSATFDDFPTFSSDLADDFVVPAGQTWNVESIDADGVYFNGAGPAFDWNVFIYTDCAGLPGTQIFSTLNQPVSVVGTTFTVTLPVPAVLGEGTYWIEIQANMDFATQGEWGWTDRTVQSNNPAAWQNPGGGLLVCPTWGVRTTCVGDAGAPDQVYRINGTIGGSGTPAPTCAPPTPTPTPTGTPIPCGTYTTTAGTDTIVPGVTDTGNHCDDCSTAITFPFPVSVYGQIFSVANVSSNGSLDLIGNQSPFTTGCVTLPNAFWNMAILPYQDDLETVTGLPGCSTWTNGCGVFTATTGTAPNRNFYIEWHAVYFANTAGAADFEVVFYENNAGIFDIIYGATSDNGSGETSGVQASSTGHATTFSCAAATLTDGLKVTYTCAVPTPTPTPPCGEPGAWSFVAPYPETLESAAIATDGTFAYGAGGDFNAVPTNGFYRYDPVADSWSTLAPLPQALFDAR